MEWGTSGQPRQVHIWIGEKELRNEGRSWNGKLIGKLLLTVTVADPEQFTPKSKPVIYTGTFVKLYNCRNRGQVNEIHGMIELEKMRTSIAENPRNFDAHRIIEISSFLHIAHVVPRDQDKVVFYINNYIDWDQFNQLYDLDWIEKGIRTADAVAHKLGPASTRVTNQRLEVAREDRRKKEEMVERRKTEAMATKCRRTRGGISLSNEEEENYESDTGDETDPNQAEDDKNLLQL